MAFGVHLTFASAAAARPTKPPGARDQVARSRPQRAKQAEDRHHQLEPLVWKCFSDFSESRYHAGYSLDWFTPRSSSINCLRFWWGSTQESSLPAYCFTESQKSAQYNVIPVFGDMRTEGSFSWLKSDLSWKRKIFTPANFERFIWTCRTLKD